MSVAKGLQIHSNVSIPMSPQPAEEPARRHSLDLQDPAERPRPLYIGKHDYKPFLTGAAAVLLLLHSMVMTVVVFYLVLKRRTFKAYFKNYSTVGNGYDIAATVVLFLSLIFLSVAPPFGRKGWKFAFLIIIFVCVFYLSAFLLRIGMKSKLEFGEYVLVAYLMLACGSFGLFVNVASAKEKLRAGLGVATSFLLFAAVFLAYVYTIGKERFSPYAWEMLLYMGGAGLVSAYLNVDAELMVKNRYDFYRHNDWFLGFVHLQTDWVFRFWYDLFVGRRKISYDEGEQELEGEFEVEDEKAAKRREERTISQLTSEN